MHCEYQLKLNTLKLMKTIAAVNGNNNIKHQEFQIQLDEVQNVAYYF